MKRILCPVDGSDAAQHALSHAIAIARWYGAQLIGLHVASPEIVILSPALAGEPPGIVVPIEADRPECEKRLHGWLTPALSAGIQVEPVLDEGDAATCILDRATTWPADLIVLGTHGRRGFDRLVLGSVAEKVLRKATCPVMTVPPPAVATSKLPFSRILCAVDFSESSVAGLQLALSLARESAAHLTVLHVFEWPSDEAAARRVLEMSEFHRQWEQETGHKLAELIPDEARSWCRPETRLAFGKAYQQILHTAESEAADLIVIGVQGRNPLDVMVFGSTTNQVVRRATCPVLTLRGSPAA